MTTGEHEPDAADRLPTVTGQFAISKSGDIWHLGRHVLLCGSALSGESFRALLGIKRAQMVFADHPYNIPNSGQYVRSWSHSVSRFYDGGRRT